MEQRVSQAEGHLRVLRKRSPGLMNRKTTILEFKICGFKERGGRELKGVNAKG